MDVSTVYEVPLSFMEEGLDKLIEKKLALNLREPDVEIWNQVVERIKNPKYECSIAIVGKYVNLKDSYKKPRRSSHPRRHRQQCAREFGMGGFRGNRDPWC